MAYTIPVSTSQDPHRSDVDLKVQNQHASASTSTVSQPAVPDLSTFHPALSRETLLLGEMHGSGFADTMWLVQSEGRFIQLTELLYRVAEQCDGARTLAEIAEAVSASTEWQMNADDAEFLVMQKLVPIGIVLPPNMAVSELDRPRRSAPSLLQLGMRKRVITADMIEPIASKLQYLYNPLILLPLLAAGLMAHAWLYLDRGVGGLLSNALYTPGLLVVVFLMSILPGFWHEFGHASALRYGGGRARGIGVGIYVMDPAFYTDVTDGYRLSRWARIRTSLGGIYFDMLLSIALILGYFATGAEILLLLVVMSNINSALQFYPLVRLDGYWVLADLTGVPDFFSMMGAFIRSVVPLPRWKGAKLPPLRPWVKAFFAVYTVVAVPGVLFFMYLLLRRMPDILSMAWGATRTQIQGIPDAWQASDWLLVAAHASQLFMLGITLVGLTYFLVILSRTLLLLGIRLGNLLVGRLRPSASAVNA